VRNFECDSNAVPKDDEVHQI